MPSASCCVVSGGPAGVLLSYLLARRGIRTTLLESHADFAREFRGDTFHASSMEIMDQLGLMQKVKALVRARIPTLKMAIDDKPPSIMGDFRKLKSPFPYVAVISQADFLDMLVSEAKKFLAFQVKMQANAQALIEENNRVLGVRYQQDGNLHDLRADLVVAADGRGSRMRRAAGWKLIPGKAPAMDVIWFRLPHEARDAELEEGVAIRISSGGHMLVLIDRGDSWQGGFVVMKRGLKELRDQGLEVFQAELKKLLPDFLRSRVEGLDDWNKKSVLAVQVGHLEKWFKPGLLLIGDAAHVMSPVGGVGINYAIQDAVAAHNLLAGPLASGTLTEDNLAAVQRRRERAVRVMQNIQTLIQNKLIKAALVPAIEFELPFALRLATKVPATNRVLAWMLAYGLRNERIDL